MGQGNGRGGPAAERPLSPHLQIYRPQINMVMSIVHRITGAGLYFGMLLLAWWLLAAATGPGPYADVSWFFGTLIGKLILFGFTWALMHHALGGVRHLIWDTGRGFEWQLEMFGPRPGVFGLWSISDRVSDMGGRFSVDSAPGHGSRFRLDFPLPR